MADIKFKFNLETEEIELLVNDKVATTVESEIVESWISAYNDKHGFVKPPEEVESASEVKPEGEENEQQEESSSGTEG